MNCNKLVMGLLVRAPTGSSVQGSSLQIGIRYGYQTQQFADLSPKVFTERVDSPGCVGGSRLTWGAPSAQNAAYYIYYTNSSTNMFCIPYYTYGLKRDDWFNAPPTLLLHSVLSPLWSAQQELGSLRPSPPWHWLGTTLHGSPASDLGHGMAWYNQPLGTWNEWSSSIGTTVNVVNGAPVQYCDDAGSSYRAFHTVKPPTGC